MGKSKDATIMCIANQQFETLQFIVNNIDRDICYLNDEEIYALIVKEQEEKIHKQKNLSHYLKYIKNYYKNETKFSLNNTVVIKQNIKTKDDFYTMEEWCFFEKYLCDIDKHIINAFENKAYAKYWLFFILHLSLTWRKNDIVSLPSLDFLEIDKYSLEWFCDNEFSFCDAMYIISNTKLFVEQKYTHKTESKLHFNISTNLILPTAIALLIMERWRRQEDSEHLFISKTIEKHVCHKYFDGLMDNFSSLKANRTLLSLVNKKANELDISQSISIASYMRSHKMNCYNTSDSTNIYLKSTYDNKELHSISKSLFEKGAFGWLFDYVVSTYEEDKNIQFKSYDIDILENVSEYLVSERCNKKAVIAELLQYSKEELENILKGDIVSKQEYVYCIKQVCDKRIDNNCIECKYSIPTIYAMFAIADEINILVDKVKQTDIQYTRDRERYLYRLLRLLEIAKAFKNLYGEECLNLFIDFNVALQETKLLLGG